MSVSHLDLGPRQDDVLRVLDTRLACLLVDRGGPEALRGQLLRLRRKLASEPVDPATLARVEATVGALGPRRRRRRAAAPSPPRRTVPAGELAARALAGAIGLTGLATLLMQVS